jgi:heme A synthase
MGVLWLLVPEMLLAVWGTPHPDAIAVYMARRYGALFFGYAIILWLTRSAGPSPARKAILAGSAGLTTVITVVSLVGVLTGVVGPAVWSAVLVEALLAAAFTYYYATAP